MDLFRRAGRKIERLKRSVESAADAEVTHGCPACGERYYTARDECDECGGLVEPLT